MEKTARFAGLGLLLALGAVDVCAVKPALAQPAPADPLARYAACRLSHGPEVVETATLAEGVSRRPVDTDDGRKMVELEAGKRVMFAYPDEEFYANVKSEQLATATYAAQKKILIDNFDHLLATSPGDTRNYALKPTLHGFPILGLDREKLEGGVLGLYLFFDDIRHQVVTIYFLNQENRKHFQTIREYASLRDQFLESYTSCLATEQVRTSHSGATP